MPTPRRPGAHTSLGDHEKRIRALERNKPPQTPWDPAWFVIWNTCTQLTAGSFVQFDWAVYEGEECTDPFDPPTPAAGAFYTNDPDTFSFSWLDPDDRDKVNYNSEGVYLVAAELQFNQEVEILPGEDPYFIKIQAGQSAIRWGVGEIWGNDLAFNQSFGGDQQNQLFDFAVFTTLGTHALAEPFSHGFTLNYGFEPSVGAVQPVNAFMYGIELAPSVDFDWGADSTVFPLLA